jgi:hypothetical protein
MEVFFVELEQPEIEEGEGYLYPLPKIVVAALGADYPARSGAYYPAHLDYPALGPIITPHLIDEHAGP